MEDMRSASMSETRRAGIDKKALCRAGDILDVEQTGTEWTFTLRQGVKFPTARPRPRATRKASLDRNIKIGMVAYTSSASNHRGR
jgi:hypothetical protein